MQKQNKEFHEEDDYDHKLTRLIEAEMSPFPIPYKPKERAEEEHSDAFKHSIMLFNLFGWSRFTHTNY